MGLRFSKAHQQVEKMSIQRQLRMKMGELFSLNELKDIAFDLSINFDDLHGEGMSGKINGLLVASFRLDKLQLLYEILENERPKAPWPSLVEIENIEWPQLVEMIELPQSIINQIEAQTTVGSVDGDVVGQDANKAGRDLNQTEINIGKGSVFQGDVIANKGIVIGGDSIQKRK